MSASEAQAAAIRQLEQEINRIEALPAKQIQVGRESFITKDQHLRELRQRLHQLQAEQDQGKLF